VVLVSRSGPRAPGAEELRRELGELGGRVTIAACDTAERAQLAAVLDDVPSEYPLVGVVHAAGVLDDGLIHTLTPEQVERVLRPKLDAAVNLHELTAGTDLEWFVLFSSASGVLGGAGQGNYAAANAFLDALAYHRHSQGLPAVSLAWGHWGQASGMTGHLNDADHKRIARSGMVPMTNEHALALLDTATGTGEPFLMSAALDLTALASADPDHVIPLLRSLVRPRRRSARSFSAGTGPDGLAERLTRLAEPEQRRYMLDLVTSQVATVLGHGSAGAVEAEAAFSEMGFDSLTAVELRNRLTATTGLRLPATLVFDLPTPAALAEHCRQRFLASGPGRQQATTPSGTPPRATSEGLGRIFVSACRQGQMWEVTRAIQHLAAFRPAFAADEEPGVEVERVRLSTGGGGPEIFCWPSFAWRPSPHQYARLARGFNGVNDLSVFSLPGFRTGEPLPATAAALARIQTDALPDNGRPRVLLGHSSGGLVAAIVADLLTARGTPPAALVLIDTYRGDSTRGILSEGWADAFSGLLLDRNEDNSAVFAEDDDDAWITARARYVGLDYTMNEPSVPTLLVRASDPIVPAAGTDWQATWTGGHDVVDAPGNHFSVMEGKNVEEAGRLIRTWLASRFPRD
jgi:thioesterase domain-containing protein/acyl carrier protein